MAIEIELKAWVDDPVAVGKAIGAFGARIRTYRKTDSYWRYTPGTELGKLAAVLGRDSINLGSGIRIRREDLGKSTAVVNFKRKEVRDGIEVNDEQEFVVSDAGIFEELLSRLGLSIWIKKVKTGEAWTADGITIELSEIEGLGFFVELEILADRDDETTVAGARKRLLAMLERLGISTSMIESRYYTEMLAEKAGVKALSAP